MTQVVKKQKFLLSLGFPFYELLIHFLQPEKMVSFSGVYLPFFNFFKFINLFILLLSIYSHVHTLFGSFLHPAPLPHHPFFNRGFSF
jgi:hypothetical protein